LLELENERKLEMEEKIYEYKTQSLDEFAVALALGAEVTGVDRGDERFFTFSLKGNFDMEKTMFALASKTLNINAYALCDALRRAKSLVHKKPIS
jgi:hypothetical protein